MNTKAVTFRDLLSRGDAQLMFDARRPDVVVPDDMIGNACMRLLFGYDHEIKNFEIDDVKGVSALLRFQTPAGIVEELPVSIPWAAVFGIVDDKDRLAVFGADVPSDVKLTGNKLEPERASAALRPVSESTTGEKRIEIDLRRAARELRH